MTDERVRTKIPAEFSAGHVSGKGEVRNVSAGGLFVGTLAIPEEGLLVLRAAVDDREPRRHEIKAMQRPQQQQQIRPS